MVASFVVDHWPLYGTGPLARLISANALDLGGAALQRTNEVPLVVRQALGCAVVDADRERVGVEMHHALWLL